MAKEKTMREIVRVLQPEHGGDCRYIKNFRAGYGICTLSANRGAFCDINGKPHSNCPLPGYDYKEGENGN